MEPTSSGVYKKEIYEVLKDDVEELEELIGRVTGEILELKFWDRQCDDKKCKFCALRQMLA